MIAVPDALAPTTFEVDADPTVHDPMAYDLPFSNDLFPAATGANPGGILGTAQANPCCWLTPIGP